ncbi:MAG: biopolymer transporter ExbD [Thiobacillus sp.]|uniref:ExbD/TolR family protein n=1 Tax=Thiobacillus sp. TaxID=924 RepID=UPI002895C6C6|nr:biopolymer transporter ExbD [Thiobacillus sp.]MDT3706706.1 biopolymer transporter ExbD [Thiobacillus sp.]
MKNSRRVKRMERSSRKLAATLSLTSLMDVFTILVLYLLVNQSSGTVLDPPKDVKLPDSIVETQPRETLLVSVSDEQVVVDGVLTATVQEILANQDDVIVPIRDRMAQKKESTLSKTEQAIDQSTEVTIMANKAVHFKVLKRVMTSCTAAGFTKISLAVNQK